MSGLKADLFDLILRIKSSTPQRMARYAYSHTKFYNAHYRGHSLDDFEALPVVTKHDLVGVSPYALLSDEFRDKVILYGETSGSSGSPTPAFFTKSDYDGLVALSALSPFASELKKAATENRMAINGLTFGFTIAGFSFGAILQKAGFTVAQLGTRSTIATPKRIAETIVKLKPSAISATPLDLMAWLAIIKMDYPRDYDEVVGNLNFLLSTAEPCALSRQRQIEDHFQLTHINTYASVDGLVSLNCPCGEMHLIDHILEIELFDASMEPGGHYGSGRLCFTNLIRRSTPMVRYLLDDLVTVKRSDCRYGYRNSIYPRGRYELSVDMKCGIMGNLDFEEIIYRHGLFMNYSMDIHDDGIEILLEKYNSEELDISGLEREISEATGIKCQANLVPLGEMTPYRLVRDAKSILKVRDLRKSSRQEMPVVL